MLDYRINTFLSVCRHMNFTKAAEELNMTQPAVSQHIKFLEEKYGLPLFVRENRTPELTPAGQVLLSSLESMHNDETRITENMRLSMEGRKVLHFGVTMTIGEYTIVPVLAELIKNHPDTDIHVHYANTDTLEEYLHKGIISFAIVEGTISCSDFSRRIFRSEEYIAAGSPARFTGETVSITDLTSENLILREEGSGTRWILEQALAMRNMSVRDFRNIIQIENLHSIVSLAEADCGITFLYRAAAEESLKKGTLVEIPVSEFSIMHDFTFIWDGRSVFSGQCQEIFDEIMKYDRQINGGDEI